jgi:hypothetical protein
LGTCCARRVAADKLETAPKFDADLEAALRDSITEFKAQYVKDNPKAIAA